MNCKLSRNKIGALVISILTAFSFSGVEASIVSAADVMITSETQQLNAGVGYCITDIDGLFALARLVNTGEVAANEYPYDGLQPEPRERLCRIADTLYSRDNGPCIYLINDIVVDEENCNNFEPIGRFESIESEAVAPSAGEGCGGETAIDNQLEAIDDDDDDDDDGGREDYWTRQNKKQEHPSSSSSSTSSTSSTVATSSPSPSSSSTITPSTSSSSSSAPLVSAPVNFSEEGNPCVQFNANFDGCGHTITLEQVKRTNVAGVALFGCIGRSGVVCNLKIAGKIQGIDAVGGISAINYGLISHCTNLATIIGINIDPAIIAGTNTDTGGIAAGNFGEICNCRNAGTVVGKYNVGGIVGRNYIGGLVLNIVHSGKVSGIFGTTGECVGKDCNAKNSRFIINSTEEARITYLHEEGN